MPNYKKNWFKKQFPQINPNLGIKATNFENSPKHGYYGFKLYFPEESDSDEAVIKFSKVFEQFFAKHKTNYDFSKIREDKWFSVDYKSLTNDQSINDCDYFKTEIVSNSEFCLNCISLAMHQTIINDTSEDHSQIQNLRIIRARLVNYAPIQLIRDIRVNYYGKLISIRGTVIRAGNSKIMPQYLAFSCSNCAAIQIVKQSEGVFNPPKKCVTTDCRAQSNFNPLYSSEHTKTVSWQTIKVQELIGADDFENGKVPRTLECELTEDLVNSCVPGDDITLIGVIKVRNEKSKNQKTVFQMYLDAVSVINNKNQSQGTYGAAERISFDIKDCYAIQTIHEEPQLFRFLVQSLAPNIYGHEIVKAGLLLALFGGTKSSSNRAESHVLMVGDPGLGKSQMLQACTNVAPRGVYVCGNTSTSSGLTVTITRETGGEFALEAGALMLADQGCCCIDEFDKMPTQHACLLEAMEQQSISIAKAGIVCTLPTRATILAAANPAGGHYNKAKTIAENLKIGSPMLSRFDLIFILLDQPNEELDAKLSEHILAIHLTKGANNSLNTASFSNNSETNNSLKDRLRLKNGENMEYLSHNLFRKYIAYAQKYVNPKLSNEAKTVIENFYFKLRKQFQNGDSTPVTTRQLNSLIRLTQARAKAELREEATEADALDVVEIMQESLIDIFTDDMGVLDTTRSQNGSGMSTKNQVKKLLSLMQKQAESQTKSLFTVKEIREISEKAGIEKMKFHNVFESLNIQGFILNKGQSRYQLVTADL